jgi:primosomal protein N'
MTQNAIFCIHCGYANSQESRFCLQCGQAIVKLEAPVIEKASEEQIALEQPKPETDQPWIPASRNSINSLECPYCSSKMQVPAKVEQLICLECAASLEVFREDDSVRLEILTF